MFSFELQSECGAARAGLLRRPHGDVHSPMFMPVGTQGTVRTLSPGDLRQIGTQIVLGNTYHLHVRPGEDVVTALGGLHNFMAWDRPILTDSGGFQVFSLEGTSSVDDEGVTFRSHVDGGERRLSPERVMEIQWTLGADVVMAFDHVIPGTSDRATAEAALERTGRWLERCRSHHKQCSDRDPHQIQTLWPIVQGGTYLDLRRRAVDQILQLQRLSEEQRFTIRVVAQVLPFRVNQYVIDQLIAWDDVPDDPMFRLVFPQAEMLAPEHFGRIADLLRSGADKAAVKAVAQEIHRELNPHPAGQTTLNVPRVGNEYLRGATRANRGICHR